MALNILAQWLKRAHVLNQYQQLDYFDLAATVCQSASLFTFSDSSSAYDLRAAMADFAAVLGPVLQRTISMLPQQQRFARWKKFVSTLTA